MTWREVKVAALQKMFVVAAGEIVNNESTAQYLAAMPTAANEGMTRAVAAGKGEVKLLLIEHEPPKNGAGVVRYDLRELAPDFYRLKEDGMSAESKGKVRRNPPYGWEGASTLVLMAAKPGIYRVPYYAAPTPLNCETADSFEMPLSEPVCVLLPLYIASALYKDDDLALATMYRNEFEVGLEGAHNPADVPAEDEFVSESGWC